jgi:hypothetical protein
MKKLFFFALIGAFAIPAVAQEVDSLEVAKQIQTEQQNAALEARMEYDRSSLAVAMIYHSEDEFGGDIKTAFEVMPFPEKYDDHNVGLTVIDNAAIPEVKKKHVGLIKAQYGKRLSAKDIEKNAAALESLLNQAHVANYMIAKWFGLYESDVCNVDLIKYRGQYNATELDVAVANQSARGLAMLADAGEMLIGNTYMLINDMTYVTAEEKAAAAKVGLAIVGGILDAALGSNIGSDLAKAGGQIADSFTGFAVKTHSYLFRLVWDEETAATFYNEYYITEPDPEKLDKFLKDERFMIKYVAHEYETSEKSVAKGKIDRSDLVKIVCTRSMDKNIAALQLQYEDFKVKTPVNEVVLNKKGKVLGYGVKIGLKAGINEKSTFQVVRKEIDPNTNKTKYKYVASLKAVKGQIWDNRYMAASDEAQDSDLTFSILKKTGGGEILPGMLVIEGKYSKVTH